METAVITLMGVMVGSAIAFFSTWFFSRKQEKERRKCVIEVICAKLDFFFMQFCLTCNEGTEAYAKLTICAEKLFKGSTYQSLTSAGNTLKNIEKSKEFAVLKRELYSKVDPDLLKLFLESVIKDDFISNDHDVFFLGRPFLVYKVELQSCVSTMLSHLYLINKKKKPSNALNGLLYNALRAFYLFEQIKKFIRAKTEEYP